MTKPRLVKLVRDGVGRFLPEGSTGIRYAPIEDKEVFLAELRKKLVEEAVEYLEAPSVGELGDVYEVIRALAAYDLGVAFDAVVDEATAKADERGGFSRWMGMWVETTASPRHEG